MSRNSAPRPLRMLVAIALAATLVACASRGEGAKPPAETPIDLARYMGRWHLVAHVPDFSERGHVASSVEYRLQDADDVAVRYSYRTGFTQPEKTLEARASVHGGTGNRDWRTWLFGMLPVKSRILEVAPDYSWSLVSYPARNQGWILAREPVPDDVLYLDLEKRMRDYGIDTDKMRRVPQRPEQVGKLGFSYPDQP